MSSVNMVKYFFYKGMTPSTQEELRKVIALAYQTARDRRLYPRAILIRSKHHDTTTINGVIQKDPKGWHLTFCYKDQSQLTSKTHVACHGYTSDQYSFDLVDSTHAGEKSDAMKRKATGKAVWPSVAELDEAPEVGYSHFPEYES